MYLTKKLKIEETDTADVLFDKLAHLGGEAIVEFMDNYTSLINKGVKQNEQESTYFPMLTKEMSKLDFNNDTDKLVNLIRGLSTSMTSYFVHNNLRYKVIFAKTFTGEIDNNAKAGEVLLSSGKQGLVIKTKNGAIEIVTIQPEGKKEMTAKDFCNSGKIKQGEIIK